jgi:hypothetical protein
MNNELLALNSQAVGELSEGIITHGFTPPRSDCFEYTAARQQVESKPEGALV